LTTLTVLLTLLYPLAIWLGQGRIEPRWLAVLLLLVASTRLPTLAISQLARWSAACALVLVAVAIWYNALLPLKLYPVLVNLAFLATFAYSLRVPPSMIERFARLTESNLPPEAIHYTRRVTQVWCGFFILNGSIAAGTAIWASQALWSLYTGVISYGLMGLLFAIEYLCRLRFKRLHQARIN
jgi:uncharacterized membrane protein